MGILPMTTWTTTFLLWQFPYTGGRTQLSPFSPCVCFHVHTCVHGTHAHSLLSVKHGLYSCLHFFLFFKAFRSKRFQMESPWLVPRGLWVQWVPKLSHRSYCLVPHAHSSHREQWLLTRHSRPSTEIDPTTKVKL